MGNLEKILSTASIDETLNSIAKKYLRKDGFRQSGVICQKYEREKSDPIAFSLGLKIPRIEILDLPEIPIGSIYVSNQLIDAVSDGELEFVILHETGHIVNNHLISSALVHIGKTVVVSWLSDTLDLSVEKVRSGIGILKSLYITFTEKKTFEEELTKQKEIEADTYAANLQERKEPAISVLNIIVDGKIDAPTHVNVDGDFEFPAVTARERIEAIRKDSI